MKPARRMFTIIIVIVIAIILQEWRIGRGLEDLHSTSARHRQGEAAAHQVNLHIKGKGIIQGKICKKKKNSYFFYEIIQLRYRYGSRGPAEADEQAVKNNFIYTGRYNIPSAKVYNKVTFIWKYNQKGTWNLNLLTAQVQVDTSHKCSKQVVGPLTHWGRDFSREKIMKANHNLLSLCWRERSNRNNLISLSSRRPWIKIFRDPHVGALLYFDHADPVNEI